ncbi:MAB_1171c family putative transporter [Streptomyces racemochromogenes]|uniref:MAB_1171c family putative transporter n=1 Tax=Streptomyces racemochromogenes TaxID=67353 RepID=A0ABW7PAV1_9ACTN
MTSDKYYIPLLIPAVILTLAFVLRLPVIMRFWRNDPNVRSLGGLLLLGSAVFYCGRPKTLALVNRSTGVSNVAAPLVYSLITMFCASCLILIIHWRGGDPRRVRRTNWSIGAVYAAVVAGLWITFALADVPVERLRDLDTYYANAPWMREHILLYLGAHTVACLITSVVTWAWLREVSGWLRAGLVFLVLGFVLNLCYDTVKLVAVSARWTGHDLDWLSTFVAPPIASVGALFIAVGFILPHAGQAAQALWADYRQYRSLAPFVRELDGLDTGSLRLPRRSPVSRRLVQRRTQISDGLLRLQPYMDPAVRDRAFAEALALDEAPAQAAATAEAVAVVAAVRSLRLGLAAAPGEAAGAPGEAGAVPVPARSPDLVAVSRALRRSPVVGSFRARSGAPGRPQGVRP